MSDLPSTIGPYRVLGRLGKGGFAQTFLVTRPGNGGPEHRLCLKRITTAFADDESFRREFLDEARMLALLNHDSIVKTFEYGEEDGLPYLVMELVEGCNLAQLLAQLRLDGGRLPSTVATYIAAEACSALAYAHTLTDEEGAPLDIVHRDVTASNILLSRYGAVKLFDFGIALASFRAGGKHTETGATKGTRPYMSPEHYNPPLLDARSDIFSLGVVLYEMLAGRLPYRAEDNVSMAASFRALSTGALIPLEDVAPHLEPDLIALVRQMLALNKDERPSSAREVRRRLLRTAQRPDARDLLEELVSSVSSTVRRKAEDSTVPATDLPDIAAAKAALAPYRPRTDSAIVNESEIVEVAPSTKAAPKQRARRALRRPALVAAIAAVLCVPALYLLLPTTDAEQQKEQPTAASDRLHPGAPTATPPAPALVQTAPPAATAQTVQSSTQIPAVTSADAAVAAATGPEAPPKAADDVAARKPATVHVRVANYGWVSIDARSTQRAPLDTKLRPGVHSIAISLDEGSPAVVRDRIKLQAGEERTFSYDVTRFVKP